MKKLNNPTSLNESFATFVEEQPYLNDDEKQAAIALFSEPYVRETIRVGVVLVGWSILYSSADAMLLGVGVVHTAVSGFDIFHYLPWFLLTTGNFTTKLILFTWYDRNKTFTDRQRILAAIPSFGVIFFLADVFATKKSFLKTVRAYFHFLRKQGLKFIVSLIRPRV